ncbi:trypsin-1-like [Ixodes scapularis]
MTFAKVSAVCGVRGSSTVNTGGGSDNTSTSNGSDAVVDTFDFSENTRGLHRIVGGVDAGPLEFPWQISLRRQVPLLNIDRGHMCGGSIVNEQFVVTAAHCVDEPVAIPASYVVVVGDQNINKKDSTEDRIGVTYLRQHPKWNLATKNYDYAIVKLARKLDFTGKHKHLMPICLPEKDQSFDGETCTASGWGLTKDPSEGGAQMPALLQQVDLPIVPYNVCKEYYKDVNEVHEDTMICAGLEEGGKSVCYGDSGGPLQCAREDGHYVLAGATSWGTTCAAPKQPGVFSKIATQLDWIRMVTGAGEE